MTRLEEDADNVGGVTRLDDDVGRVMRLEDDADDVGGVVRFVNDIRI